MNEQFWALDEEKRLRIINAALEVFATNDYKRSVTDDIAAKAGISKGLLFYYFNNKKSLYTFLYSYCGKVMIEEVVDNSLLEITDFFELLRVTGEKKYKVLEKMPYIYDFSIKAYFSSIEEMETHISDIRDVGISLINEELFKNIDFTKFKEGTDIQRIINILIWSTEGYISDIRKRKLELSLEEIMKEYNSWLEMFKKMSYKEEYL